MKYWLFRVSGQVGFELQHSFWSLGELETCSHEEINLEDEAKVCVIIREYKPKVIINAAA